MIGSYIVMRFLEKLYEIQVTALVILHLMCFKDSSVMECPHFQGNPLVILWILPHY